VPVTRGERSTQIDDMRRLPVFTPIQCCLKRQPLHAIALRFGQQPVATNSSWDVAHTLHPYCARCAGRADNAHLVRRVCSYGSLSCPGGPDCREMLEVRVVRESERKTLMTVSSSRSREGKRLDAGISSRRSARSASTWLRARPPRLSAPTQNDPSE
jgi:hypothetical protein